MRKRTLKSVVLGEAAAKGRKGFSIGFSGDIANAKGPEITGFGDVTEQRWSDPEEQVNETLEYEMGSYEAANLVDKVSGIADELAEHAEKAANAGDALFAKQLKQLVRDAQRFTAKMNDVLLGSETPSVW